MILKLFFNPRNKQHYYIPDEKLICNYCNKEIYRIIIFRFNWSKKSYMERFCLNCIKKRKEIKKISIVEENYLALIIDRPPKSSYPIFIRPPNLQSLRSDITVFEAGNINFREKDQPTSNYNKLQCIRRIKKIDSEKQKNLLKERIDELRSIFGKFGNLDKENIDGITAYLKDIQDSKPILEYNGKKLLSKNDEKVNYEIKNS